MDLSRRAVLVATIVLLTIISTAGLNIYAQTTTTASPETTNVSIVSGASNPPACYVGSGCGTNYLYGYDPPTITVVLGVNNTVVWTNEDGNATHSVTSSAGDPENFTSGCIGPGCSPPTPKTYTYTFAKAGVYYYHCIYHDWMEGKVIVLAASTTTSNTHASSTTSSSGIPEFPGEPLAVAALAIIVVLAYVALRRPSRTSRQAPA